MATAPTVDLKIPHDPAARAATSRTPVVGDAARGMVLYRADINQCVEHPAIVTRVFEPMTEGGGYVLNLSIICDGGSVIARGLVRYDAGDDREPKPGTWRWPVRG